MKKIEKIVVVDVGNGNTNYVAGNNTSGEFPSLVSRYDTSTHHGITSVKPFKMKEGRYLVGHDAKSSVIPTRSTDSMYYKSNEYKVCLMYALHKVGIKDPILALSLPTEFYGKLKVEFEAKVRSWLKEEGYNVHVIYVYPQHAGPFYDPSLVDENGVSLDPEIMRSGRIGIIDIGQGTLDIGEFEDGIPTRRYFGESYGISDIHKEVFTALSNPGDKKLIGTPSKSGLPREFELDSTTTLQTLDSWFRSGFMMYCGKKIDMWKLSRNARQDYAKKYISRGITELWKNTNFLNGMILAGGGSLYFERELLADYVTCTIYSAKDPGMSVARGFFELTRLRILSTNKGS